MRRRRQNRFPSVVTPQQKAININDKFGNKGIAKQQGTTRHLYDSLLLDGRTVYNFFQEANTRQFPLANLGGFGRLEVGETLVIESAYMAQVTIAAGVPTAINPVLAGTVAVSSGEFSFSIANNTVVKPIPMLSFADGYNAAAQFQQQNVFEFATQIVIPPMVEFFATVKMGVGLTVADTYLRMTISGVGAILAPRNTF